MALRAAPRTVVLDAEALSALAAQRPHAWAMLAAAEYADQRVVVPAIVLAEVMTGKATDAALWRIVNKLPRVDIDTGLAAAAGGLRDAAVAARRKKRDLTVDAVVAAVAVQSAPSVVLTADVDDLRLLVAEHDVVVTRV